MSCAASVVPSGTEQGCGWYLCVSIFSAVVEKEKPNPSSPSSALAALGPGDELEVLRNFPYMQLLATVSCTSSLRTTWRMMLVCFPFILLPAGCLWWLLSRKRWFDHSVYAFSMLLSIYVPLIPLWCLSHHSPAICLCTSGYLSFSGGASIAATLFWVVCRLALIRRNKPTNIEDIAGCHEWFIIISSWNHLTFAITWSPFAVLESGRNISPVEHNGGHSSKQNCMYCRWLQYNFIDFKCFK